MYTQARELTTHNISQILASVNDRNHFGLKLYKDDEVFGVEVDDTRNMWNILLFNSNVYSIDMGFIEPGLYVAPIMNLADGFELGVDFSGCLLSIPFDSWKAFDIYGLDRLFISYTYLPYVKLNKKESRSVELMMDIMNDAIKSGQDSSDDNVELVYLLRALMATINRYYSTQRTQVRSLTGNKISDEFLRLVPKNCLKEKKLDFYAEQIGVTSKYLSHVVVSTTGKKANKWIAESVIERVKVMLKNTSLSISEISEITRFPDTSCFCRYFRAHAGLSPLEYKKNVLHDSSQGTSPRKKGERHRK